MSTCDCTKKRDWQSRRKWILEIFDKHCKNDVRCQNKMIKDETWLSFMKDRHWRIDPEGLRDISVIDIHNALKWKYNGDKMDQKSNDTGIFRDNMKPARGRREWYFMVRPVPPGKDSVDRYNKDDVENWRNKRQLPTGWKEPADESPKKKKARAEQPEDDDKETEVDRPAEGEADAVRPQNGSAAASSNDFDDDEVVTVATDESTCYESDSDSDDDYEDSIDDAFESFRLPDGMMVWYNSTEAAKIHCPREKQTAYDAIEEQIRICLGVSNHKIPWEAVIDGHGLKDYVSDYVIHKTKMQCQYIATALQIRLETPPAGPESVTWRECCERAVKRCKDASIVFANNGQTVEKYYRDFRDNRKFPNPCKGKTSLPPFLQCNPEISGRIMSFAKEHLKDLDVRMVRDFIVDKLVPKMAKEEKITEEEYLKRHRLTKLCNRTVLNWLHALGFSYEVRRKSYYVDGHEKPGTIRYRWKFIARYFAHERRMHRWYQITEDRAMELAKEYPILDHCGFHYESEDGTKMVEFHVDTIDLFQKEVDNDPTILFGGNLSVRKKDNERPLISVGQDECIFKQYLLKSKTWTHEGKRVIVPKDEGYGVMISAFMSRELGFGVVISQEQLDEINRRRRGKHYADKDAATFITNSTAKQDLTESPFVKTFEYGQSAEGYWTYERMVLQVEDCVDCLKVLYPQYDFLFLFDHSCGHDRGQTDGLNAKRMAVSFGGKQPKMHPTIIEAEDGYLGPHRHSSVLSVGEEQKMVWPVYSDEEFDKDKHGPYWMTPQMREARRKTVYGDIEERDKTVDELKKEIFEQKNIRVRGVRAKIVQEAERLGISIRMRERKVLTRGWEGEAKGLLQVLWERGWIDPARPKSWYMKHGSKDDTDAVIPESNLQEMMMNCLDFEEEKTLLQKMVDNMSDRPGQFFLDRTPKCHCEMAGEGIEYAWGCAKNYYRALPLEEHKKGKDKFLASVKKSISREILTTDRCRKFSRRARRYMGAYLAIKEDAKTLAAANSGTSDAEAVAIDPEMLAKVEKMVRNFKVHRCAMDFDGGFCKEVMG